MFERKFTHLLRCFKLLKSSCTVVHSGFRNSCTLHMGNFSPKHGVFDQALNSIFASKRVWDLIPKPFLKIYAIFTWCLVLLLNRIIIKRADAVRAAKRPYHIPKIPISNENPRIYPHGSPISQ